MFIEVLKFTKKKGSDALSLEPESIPLASIKSARKWEPSEEEKNIGATNCVKIKFNDGSSITIAESYESWCSRTGTIRTEEVK